MSRVFGLDCERMIAEGRLPGRYIINKFGKNVDVDAAGEDIWDGGAAYTGFPTTTAEEFQILSSDANDTSAGTGARTVRVFYLNSSYEAFDSSGNFLYFDVSLNGTAPVNSGVTGMRVWRAYVLTAGSGTTNAGTITVRWRTTTSVVFTVMPIGESQSHITAFTVPLGYTLYINRFRSCMLDTTANQARLEWLIRPYGGAYRAIRDFHVSTAYTVQSSIFGGYKIDPRTDIVVRCTNILNTNGYITLEWDGILVKDIL